jgi:hypothetical protein
MMFGQEPGFTTPEVLVELWLASGIQDYAFISSWHGKSHCSLKGTMDP